MKPGHRCNWPGCKLVVPYDMWGCKPHWYGLPLAIRNRISNAWRFGRGRGSRAWSEGHNAALEFVKGLGNIAERSRVSTPIPTKEEKC